MYEAGLEIGSPCCEGNFAHHLEFRDDYEGIKSIGPIKNKECEVSSITKWF